MQYRHHTRRMQNNTCETWESKYGWELRQTICIKHSWARMLHMTMIQMCWHADLQSLYLLCKSLYMAGFAQRTNTHFLSQEGAGDQALKSYEDLQSVHELWNNSSKHKKMSHWKTFCAVFTDSWPAHSSMKTRRVSVSRRKSVKEIASCLIIAEIKHAWQRWGNYIPAALSAQA
jgi:hypothetical protein